MNAEPFLYRIVGFVYVSATLPIWRSIGSEHFIKHVYPASETAMLPLNKMAVSNSRMERSSSKDNQYSKKAVSCEVSQQKNSQSSSVLWVLDVVGRPYIEHWYDAFKSIIIIGFCVFKPLVQLPVYTEYVGIEDKKKRFINTSTCSWSGSRVY